MSDELKSIKDSLGVCHTSFLTNKTESSIFQLYHELQLPKLPQCLYEKRIAMFMDLKARDP